MKAEVFNSKPQPGSSILVLFLLALGCVLAGVWDVTGQPVVYYSHKTNRPISIETESGTKTVTPSTVLPEKYDKVWVP